MANSPVQDLRKSVFRPLSPWERVRVRDLKGKDFFQMKTLIPAFSNPHPKPLSHRERDSIVPFSLWEKG
jgi:hypothetical protein